jgi:hypothetical protein
MKKYILIIILISTTTFAQSSVTSEELKNIIKDNNTYWLRGLFDELYTDKYFIETKLETYDITSQIVKSNVYIKSIKVVEEDSEVIKRCQKALNFNENYLKLYELRKLLNEKFNEEKNNNALNEINKLPELELNSKLNIYKSSLYKYLENYKDNTCLLKLKLDVYKNADQISNKLKLSYAALLIDAHFKDYPYLIYVIKNISKNVNNYSKSDLQPCEELKTNTPATVKLEVTKESSTTKDEQPKKIN